MVAISAVLAGRSQSRADFITYFNEGLNQASPNPRGLYDFDTATGVSTFRTALSDTTSRFFAFDVRPSDGVVFGLTLDGELTMVNPFTGLVTPVGNTGISSAVGLAIRPTDGAMFALREDGALFSVNPMNGLASLLGKSSGQDGDRGLVASSSGQLYVFGGQGMLYRIDATNGQTTFISPLETAVVQAEDATFTPAGNLFLLDRDNNHVILVNPLTARSSIVGTAVGTGLLGVFSMAVPEPSSIALCGIGSLIGLGYAWRRNRRIILRRGGVVSYPEIKVTNVAAPSS